MKMRNKHSDQKKTNIPMRGRHKSKYTLRSMDPKIKLISILNRNEMKCWTKFMLLDLNEMNAWTQHASQYCWCCCCWRIWLKDFTFYGWFNWCSSPRWEACMLKFVEMKFTCSVTQIYISNIQDWNHRRSQELGLPYMRHIRIIKCKSEAYAPR